MRRSRLPCRGSEDCGSLGRRNPARQEGESRQGRSSCPRRHYGGSVEIRSVEAGRDALALRGFRSKVKMASSRTKPLFRRSEGSREYRTNLCTNPASFGKTKEASFLERKPLLFFALLFFALLFFALLFFALLFFALLFFALLFFASLFFASFANP